MAHDDGGCCRPEPQGQLPVEDAAVVRSTAEEVKRYARISTKIELALVALGLVVVIGAAVVASVAVVRLKDLAESNRKVLAALQDQQRRSAEGAQFAVDAVNCIRYTLVEHRWVNEAYHEEQAVALHIPLPEHRPLPPRPSQAEIDMACKAFNEQPQPPPDVTVPPGPLPTKGGK